MTIKAPKAKGYQLRSDEEEASYLPLIADWQRHLDEPEMCVIILSRIMQKNRVTRRRKKPAARAASAGK